MEFFTFLILNTSDTPKPGKQPVFTTTPTDENDDYESPIEAAYKSPRDVVPRRDVGPWHSSPPHVVYDIPSVYCPRNESEDHVIRPIYEDASLIQNMQRLSISESKSSKSSIDTVEGRYHYTLSS